MTDTSNDQQGSHSDIGNEAAGGSQYSQGEQRNVGQPGANQAGDGEQDDSDDQLTSGSAGGDVSQNQDSGLFSDATGLDSESGLIEDEDDDDTDIAVVGDNIGVTGGR